jgi:acyl carrier protein
MVDDEYDVTLSGNEMKSAVTIADLFHIVEKKLG